MNKLKFIFIVLSICTNLFQSVIFAQPGRFSNAEDELEARRQAQAKLRGEGPDDHWPAHMRGEGVTPESRRMAEKVFPSQMPEYLKGSRGVKPEMYSEGKTNQNREWFVRSSPEAQRQMYESTLRTEKRHEAQKSKQNM